MKWKPENIEYLKRVYPFNSNDRIAKHFGRSCSSIQNIANNLNLNKDRDYLKLNGNRFKKGQAPWNKGIKGLIIGGVQTQFKKGNIPHNTKVDGTITTRRDKTGIYYKHIRLSIGLWRLYHRYLWEEMYEKIPNGIIVIFEDGNSMNCSIENLKLISRAENIYRNRNRKKASETMKKTWQRKKIMALYGLPLQQMI